MEQTSSRYLSARGISEKLMVGKDKAYEVLYLFRAKGKTINLGKSLRLRESYLDAWLIEQEAKERNDHEAKA